MFDSDREQELAKVFEPPSAPRPEHRTELEAALLAKFDSHVPEPRRQTMDRKQIKRKVFFGVALAAAIGLAACAAPVQVDVEVGRSVTVVYAATETMPSPHVIAKAIETSGTFDTVDVRVQRVHDEVTVQVEVWGEGLGDEPLAGKLQKALPALASATITETPLSGKVESTLGKKLGHDLFDLDITDDEDVEVVREKILAHLAAQGVEGQVKVEVEGDGKTERRIKVQVQNEEECPPENPSEKKTTP